MMNDFVSISLDSLSNVTGGRKDEQQPPPEPKKEEQEHPGKYCKDGMDFSVSGSAKGGVQTPVGLKLEGEASVDYTKCK